MSAAYDPDPLVLEAMERIFEAIDEAKICLTPEQAAEVDERLILTLEELTIDRAYVKALES